MSEGMLAPPKLPTPNGAFDALVRDLLDRMHEMAQGARATMGTITNISGGNIVVHVDGERISRSVGFARKKGVSYQVGDRVLLEPTRSDEYVVAGVIGSDATDGRVGNAQLALESVSWFELTLDLKNIINSKGTASYTRAESDAKYLTPAKADGSYAGLPNYQVVRTEVRTRLCALERKAFKGKTSGPCT